METVKIEEQRTLLKKWKRLAQEHAWLHDECSKHFLSLHYCMAIPCIFSSMGSGAVNLTNTHGSSGINYTAMILGILGLVTAGLSTMQLVLRYGERSNLHIQSSKEFEALSRDISVEVLLGESQSRTYSNTEQYVKECNDRFTLCMNRACPIPSYIFKRLPKWRAKKDDSETGNDISSNDISLDLSP